MKDGLYKKKLASIKDFDFNEDVANVFDDMLSRSIPLYHQIHGLILELIDYFFDELDQSSHPADKVIYDLGCSTGESLLLLSQHLQQRQNTFQLIGIDQSASMIEKAQEKLQNNQIKNVTLRCEDLTQSQFAEASASVVILNYTLQFLPLEQRPRLLQKIHSMLKEGGMLILCEKILYQDYQLDKAFTKLYYDFKKRNGYTELEISQKKKALHNVLFSLTPDEQLALLKKANFNKVDIFYKWYNFTGYLGLK